MVMRTPVRFLPGDAFAAGTWPGGATVVVASTTRYDTGAMARLGSVAEQMPVGGVLVCIGKPLESPLFGITSVVDVGMNWGSARVFIQRKEAMPCSPPSSPPPLALCSR